MSTVLIFLLYLLVSNKIADGINSKLTPEKDYFQINVLEQVEPEIK